MHCRTVSSIRYCGVLGYCCWMTGAYDLRSHVDRFRASILTLLIFSFTKFGLNFASDDSFVFLVEQEKAKRRSFENTMGRHAQSCCPRMSMTRQVWHCVLEQRIMRWLKWVKREFGHAPYGPKWYGEQSNIGSYSSNEDIFRMSIPVEIVIQQMQLPKLKMGFDGFEIESVLLYGIVEWS